MKRSRSFRLVFWGIIIVFFAVILMIVVNILSFVNSFVDESNREYGEGIVKTVTYRINDRIEKTEKISETISNSRDMQLYITSKNEYDRKLAFSRVFNDIRKVMEYTSDNMCIMAWNEDGTPYELINMIDNSDKKLVEKLYSDKVGGKLKNDIGLFVNGSSVIICKLQDIKMYNFSSVGIDNVGIVGVVSKINTTELKDSLNIGADVHLEITNRTLQETFDIFSPSVPHENQIISSMEIPLTGWSVICKTSANRVPYIYAKIINYVYVVLFICCIFFAIFTVVFHLMYTKPIKKIFRYIDKYTIGGKKERLESVGTYELDILLGHINNMFDLIEQDANKIVTTQEALYEKEIEFKNVLLYMYQLQIQPHFLYNTLGCINGYAIDYGIEEILNITNALAEIFRYSMEGSKIVTFGDEIKYTQMYMSIQQLRYPSLLELRIDADDEVLYANVPKMILQPIVENAVKHGILPKKSAGTVKIKAYTEQDRIKIFVSDNGVGMPPEMLKQIREMIDNCTSVIYDADNIGISNVCKRIILQYGDDFGVSVVSHENVGTTVEFELPLQYDCNDNK